MTHDIERLRPLFNRRRLEASGECLLWPANQLNDSGYGLLKYKQGRQVKKISAHRLSYLLSNGPIPEGLEILHSCDTPRCVNPAHLSVGTRLDNERDKVVKGRSLRGEQLSAVLSDLEAQEILDRYRDGESIKYLALEKDVPYKTVEAICHRRKWKYLK